MADLKSVFHIITPFRDSLVQLLSAVETSMMIEILGYDITENERRRYLHPLKALGAWEHWTRSKIAEGLSVTLVGKDIWRMLRDIRHPFSASVSPKYSLWIVAAYDRAVFPRSLQEPCLDRPHDRACQSVFAHDFPGGGIDRPSIMYRGASSDTMEIRYTQWSQFGSPKLYGRGMLVHGWANVSQSECGYARELVLKENSSTCSTTCLHITSDSWTGSNIVADIQQGEGALHHWHSLDWLSVPQDAIELAVACRVETKPGVGIAVFKIPLVRRSEDELADPAKQRGDEK